VQGTLEQLHVADAVDLDLPLQLDQPPELIILMASRRINSDRFLTNDYNASIYTQTGMDWVEGTTFTDVLKRHYPGLDPSLRGIENGFTPWSTTRPQDT
jgi:heme peroxidase